MFLTSSDLGNAISAVSAEEPEIALARATSATERSPWWPDAWHLASQAASALGDLQRAGAAAAAAIDADPLDLRGRLLLIEVDRLRDAEAVGDHLAELRELDPNGLDLHLEVLRHAREVDDEALAREAASIVEQVIDETHPRWEVLVELRDRQG